MASHDENHDPAALRIGAIDVGSNGVRILIGEVDRGEVSRLMSHRVALRLGADAFQSGCFSEQTIEQAVETFKVFRRRIDRHRVGFLRAVATSAVRNATNGQELVSRVQAETGITIDVIDGLEEAQLIFNAVSREVDLRDRTTLLIDMGGGSVELTVAHDGLAYGFESLPLGPVRLMLDLRRRQLDEGDVSELLNSYSGSVEDLLEGKLRHERPQACVGTGGNIECLARLRTSMLGKTKRNKVRISDLESLIPQLLEMPVGQRVKKLGLRPDRADVIAIAAVVLHMIVDEARVTKVQAPGLGLKDGLLHQVAREAIAASHRGPASPIDPIGITQP